MHPNLPEIRLTRQDFARLDQLLAIWTGGERLSKTADFLLHELARARIVPDVPPGTVAMHAKVRFRDDDTGRERTVVLVYPAERREAENELSVLTPLGVALIGLAEGQSIAFEGVGGALRRVTVLQVTPMAVQAGA